MNIYLEHVRANVSDLERAIQWYEDMLGFKVTGSWPPENPNYAHFGTEKGATFAIMENEEFPSRGRFNFKVSDVDALWDQLKDKAEIVEELFDTAYGSRKFTIKDLDGNELGMVQE
ncbi:VOC family protein [Virgibacillus doumboii]|uniref:VOC family protein n=1 Tax=Virgibacillus doumboii TaxID=2697503 RepID=UPI0013DFDA77|nr:VOC family protein [Virgibacillus doumboii]